MSGKLIVICGATGFIGRNMLEYFCKQKDIRIRAVFNKRPPVKVAHAVAEIEWVQSDLRDPTAVEKVMVGASIVIQAAATTSGSKDIVTKPYLHVTDNAVMNSLLLRSAYHNNIEHFIFFSCTVMYQSSTSALAETDFNASDDLHQRYFGVGHTKIYIEKMLEFFSGISKMKTTAIRHSNIYGPYDKFDFERSHVFGATISKVLLSTDEISVWGTGEEERDLLHVSDLCRFVEAAIDKQMASYRLYNCGYGQKISIKDLVNLIILKSGKSLEVKHDLSQPSIKTSLFLDCSLANTELGWVPIIPLEDGVADTISWWRDNINEETLLMEK